ncbi:MAG TPA: hypothetical protein VFF48_10265 [Brevundimonas sp.]|nr:hypothetical protein [Brevundimonas sp.]
MIAASLSVPAPRMRSATLSWSGRVLSGVAGGFLALDAISRLIALRGLVAPSEGAPTLEPSLQIPLGAALLLGSALYVLRPARLFGAGLLVLALAALIGVEAAADARSATHLLFWAYVCALVVAGLVLRRTSVSLKEPA